MKCMICKLHVCQVVKGEEKEKKKKSNLEFYFGFFLTKREKKNNFSGDSSEQPD